MGPTRFGPCPQLPDTAKVDSECRKLRAPGSLQSRYPQPQLAVCCNQPPGLRRASSKWGGGFGGQTDRTDTRERAAFPLLWCDPTNECGSYTGAENLHSPSLEGGPQHLLRGA